VPVPRRVVSRVLDWSGGIVGGVSDYARQVRHGRIIENMLLRPFGALSVREGTQRLSSATLTKKPHSAMEWVSGAGAGSIYIGAEDTNGRLYQATAGAFTEQTWPWVAQGAAKLVWDQLHGSLFATEQGGANPPMFFRSGNPANTWHSAVLPRPAFPAITSGTAVSGAGIPGGTTVSGAVAAGATTLTLSANATATAEVTLVFGTAPYQFSVPHCQTTNLSATVTYDGPGAAAGVQLTLTGAAGGGLTTGQTYYYRLRYRFTHGSGRATTNTHSIALGANTQVQITTIPDEIRSDYLGWTLERTKAGGTAAGPFYFVADGTGPTYNDVIADADLGNVSDENIHGEPPHLDGVIAYKDRLVGWAGSTIYFSQAVGDIEATGICNWNALNASDIGPDDGDTIRAVVVQVDRLAVLKRWSTWAVEGDDIVSFRAFPIYKGAGCAGPRAAAAVGSAVYFFGDAGFHRLVGNRVEPFGWVEVGHIFDTFRPGQFADVVVRNYLGQLVLVSFASATGDNDDMLVYDMRFGAWTRITGWFFSDLLVQKGGSFGDAQAIVAIDRRDLDTGGGFDYPVWLGFYGFKDQKASNGSGGTPPNVVVETPMIDDGSPVVEKDWERIQHFISGTNVSATVTIRMDPYRTSSIAIQANQSGAVWGVPLWGAFTWAQASDSGPQLGLPSGTFGRRYAHRLVCQPESDLTYKGFEMHGIAQPVHDYSRS
jgi:hypothetical protein